MRHLSTYNEAIRFKKKEDDNLLDVETLDGTIVDIFSELTDIGYSIEVLHQNGYATYNMIPPTHNLKVANDLLDAIDGSNMNLQKKEVVNNLGGYAKMLLDISEHLPEISNRVSSIYGLKEFHMYKNGSIFISFNHKPQGYGSLGNVMLVGDKSRSVYR